MFNNEGLKLNGGPANDGFGVVDEEGSTANSSGSSVAVNLFERMASNDEGVVTLVSQTFEGVATLVTTWKTEAENSSKWGNDQEAGSEVGGEVSTPDKSPIAVKNEVKGSSKSTSSAETTSSAKTSTASYTYDVIVNRSYKVEFRGGGWIDYFRGNSTVVTVSSKDRITVAAPLEPNAK